jgi:uncharacterized protein (DUF427 family)
MSLTRSGGPLVAKEPPPSNYSIDGPAHRILWSEFPRRVRGELGGETVLDTTRGRLLHESQMLPVLYVPADDVATELLEPTETHTTCPFKGIADYWSVQVGDRLSKDAVWSYPDPNPEADWLRGHLAFYWKKLDAWFDEDERVFGHLRDPFHRVDVRPTSRRAVTTSRGETLAESSRAMVLSETGLPNRIYVPREDVSCELLPSDTTAVCPYKGEAVYWSARVGDELVEDVAFTYPDPLNDAIRVGGYVCFLHDEVETILDE